METVVQGRIATEKRILSAAAVLFGRFGYNGVSTRDIALAAEVNEVTVYRHYPRKNDLYLAVLAEELGQLSLRGDLLTEIVQAPDAKRALVCTFKLIEAAVMQRPEMLRLVLYSSLEMRADLDALLRRYLGEFVELTARYLEPWVSSGEIQCSSARAMVLALVSIVVLHHPLHRVLPAGIAEPDAAFEAFAAICLGTGRRPPLSSEGANILSTRETTNKKALVIG